MQRKYHDKNCEVLRAHEEKQKQVNSDIIADRMSRSGHKCY